MRRDAFGPFATLNDRDLARLLILVGSGVTLGKLESPSRKPQTLPPPKHADATTLNIRRIERFGVQVRKRRVMRIVDRVCTIANEYWERQRKSEIKLSRLALDLEGASSDPAIYVDIEWLSALLLKAMRPAVGAVVLQPSLDASSFKWDWPLETGVVGADVGPSPLGPDFYYERFLDIVNLAVKPKPCDLLLVTGSLEDATRNALASRYEASLVVILGGGVADWHETHALLQVIRNRWRTGAIGICSVDPMEQSSWLNRFVEELTHNLPIDQALRVASEAQGTPMPLLAGDGNFVVMATLSETAKRIGRAITSDASSNRAQAPRLQNGQFSLPFESSARTMRDLGQALITSADQLTWARESGDASALIELKIAAARVASTGALLPARIGAGDLPSRPRVVRARTTDSAPPRLDFREFIDYAAASSAGPVQSSRLDTPRWVQANIFGESGGRRINRVSPNSMYAIEIAISPDKTAELVAPSALDEALLAPSWLGHSLRVAFTPLWRIDGNQMHGAQLKSIHLPAHGDSEKATFYFKTPEDLWKMRARIIVLSGNRVLQTLMLAPASRIREQAVRLALKLENLVSADLGHQTVSPEFDACIVINDDALGNSGIVVAAKGEVEFFEPEGADTIVASISKAMSILNSGSASDGADMGLEDPKLQKLLHALAIHGRSLRSAIVDHSKLASLVQPRKIQFVEAVPKGYFPIELTYEGRVPSFQATICPNARQGLLEEGFHANCEHAVSEDHYCPAAFWGFSKCIERHTAVATNSHTFSQPTSEDGVLSPFSSVLFGASKNVLPESIDPPTGIQTVVEKHGMHYVRANDWKQWKKDVATRSPSTLLLLPHSERSMKTFDAPALEISDWFHAIEGVERDYVIGPDGRRPLVMVLGCSTALTGVSFVNSISQFRKAGAAVTLGTVALITGRQSVTFVERFLLALQFAAKSGMPFDEALLRVKREMLASGNPFVLSLVSYGDSGWKLEI